MRRGPARVEERIPTSADFTPEAVRRAVLSETVQHPGTIIPLAVSGVAVAWWLLIGGGWEPALVMGAGAVVGASVWLYNFFGRGAQLANAHVEKLREKRAASRLQEGEALEEDCASAGFEDGEREARGLREAYEKLSRFLEDQATDGRMLDAVRFQALAEDTYDQGKVILRRALNAYQALEQLNVAGLETEKKSWERRLTKLDSTSSEAEALKRNIASHQRTVDLCHQRQAQVGELLVEANNLEQTLLSSFIEVTDLIGEGAGALFRDRGAASRLEDAVSAARRVEERLRGIGQADSALDRRLEEAAEAANSERKGL